MSKSGGFISDWTRLPDTRTSFGNLFFAGLDKLIFERFKVSTRGVAVWKDFRNRQRDACCRVMSKRPVAPRLKILPATWFHCMLAAMESFNDLSEPDKLAWLQLFEQQTKCAKEFCQQNDLVLLPLETGLSSSGDYFGYPLSSREESWLVQAKNVRSSQMVTRQAALG